MVQSSSASLFLSATDVISVEDDGHKQQSILQNRPNREKPLAQLLAKKPNSENVPKKYRLQIVWKNVIIFIILHAISLYAIFQSRSWKFSTIIFMCMIGCMGAIGITAGAHRLWSHKCYKAKWPLRLILMIYQTTGLQNCIYEWVRDHRVHHKFTDTDADPHNSKRGFFFSHMGWLLVRKHKDVIIKGKTVDMSDLESDQIVMWQKKHYILLATSCTFVIPTMIPYIFWCDNFWTAFTMSVLRYIISLHFTWLVNSAAHIWGMKPYDKTITAAENYFVSGATLGEGFHNYHHAFPWDYKAAELGNYSLNLSTAFIDTFAKIGWAYDLKMATPSMIRRRAERTGDRSRTFDKQIWGWDDIDMSVEDKKLVNVIGVKSMNTNI